MSSRRLRVAGLLAAATLALPSAAIATDTNVNWALGQSTTTYPSQFTIGSSASGADYRWSENLTKTTVISGNACSDGSPYISVAIGAGDQSFKRIVNGPSGLCFLLRGRVASGQGATTTRSGVVRR